MYLKYLARYKLAIIPNLKEPVLHLIQLAIIFSIARRHLNFERGMDLSDESLYLIAANPSNRYDTWGWPFGWITSVMYQMSNNQIIQFRNIGLMLLLYSSYFFAWNFSKIIEKGGTNAKVSLIRPFLICFVITTSSLQIYNGFLRTPGYNWLNLVSILFALGSFFKLTYLINLKSRFLFSFHISTLALALFISFHAKPTTPFFLMIGFILIWKKKFDLKQNLKIAISLLLSFQFIILFALLLKIWPVDFIQRFVEIISRPGLNNRATIQFGLLQIAITPFYGAYFILRNLQFQTVLLLVVSYPLLALVSKKNKEKKAFLLFMALFVSVTILSFMGMEIRDNRIHLNPVQSVDKSFLSISWFAIYLIIILPYIKKSRVREINFSKFHQTNLLLILSLIAFGFGSSSALLGKASGASIFIICLIFNAIDNLVLKVDLRLFQYFWILSLNLVLILITYTSSTKTPYRIAPVNQQLQECSSGSIDLKIKLDSNTCAKINKIREVLTKNGFSNDLLLLNMIDPWQPGVEVLLGTEHPPSLILTIPGYKGSNAVLAYNLKQFSKLRDLKKAWLILPAPNSKNLSSYKEVVTVLEIEIQINLIKSHQVVLENSEIEIWKPKL
jgi:hypothetical protein